MAKSAPPPQLDWGDAVEQLEEHLVRLSTPIAMGSGFLLSWPSATQLFAVATAAHVLDHAYDWEEPIRLEHLGSGQSVVLRPEARVILLDREHDTATLLFELPDWQPKLSQLQLAPRGAYLRVGSEVGWLGFPALAETLCFFSGRVSCWQDADQSYLIDGVAINGVSGGPTFCITEVGVMVIGVVSAYIPNMATGEPLPGLAVARDVSHFHASIEQFASLDQARAAVLKAR